jgi:hypothetical protein
MRGERRRQRSHPWTTTDPTPSIRSGPARGEDAQIGHRAGDPDRRLDDTPRCCGCCAPDGWTPVGRLLVEIVCDAGPGHSLAVNSCREPGTPLS